MKACKIPVWKSINDGRTKKIKMFYFVTKRYIEVAYFTIKPIRISQYFDFNDRNQNCIRAWKGIEFISRYVRRHFYESYIVKNYVITCFSFYKQNTL